MTRLSKVSFWSWTSKHAYIYFKTAPQINLNLTHLKEDATQNPFKHQCLTLSKLGI